MEHQKYPNEDNKWEKIEILDGSKQNPTKVGPYGSVWPVYLGPYGIVCLIFLGETIQNSCLAKS